ncbi:hypothetical protein HOLleu_38593 [Holothuria leucospilota]|uniref:IgGFc-binding protein N-terminal domain-containing protein n=1 Tax=Holothuria leucospilota TaxID=206669 RepID=A0A9Q1BDP4_HOLLE|nr:hypothetical protein HOLleu_38593 [Holothuria leucospilota]
MVSVFKESQITLPSTIQSNALDHETPVWSSLTTTNTVYQDQGLQPSTDMSESSAVFDFPGGKCPLAPPYAYVRGKTQSVSVSDLVGLGLEFLSWSRSRSRNPLVSVLVSVSDTLVSTTTLLNRDTFDSVTNVSANQEASLLPDMWEIQFLFTFLPPACDQAETRVRVFIATTTNNEDANGIGEFFDIPLVALPPDIESGRSNWYGNSTIAISADKKVVAHGFMVCSETGNVRAAAFRIRAVTELGNDYRVVTTQNTGNSQLAIVALHDETLVRISHISSSLYENVTLKPYEMYILQGSYDMTGAYIHANFPVFVLVGNYADNIYPIGLRDGEDAFYEVLTPFNQWGRLFSVVPLSDVQTGSIVKMLHWDDDTRISWTMNGRTVTQIPKAVDISRVDLFPFANDALMELNATDPILVAQFMTDFRDGGSKMTQTVSMLLSPSVSQVTNNYTVFPTFDLAGATATYHVTVWLPPNGDPSDLYVNNERRTWQVVYPWFPRDHNNKKLIPSARRYHDPTENSSPDTVKFDTSRRQKRRRI